MTRSSPLTAVLLACFFSVIGVRTMSAYDKKLELMSTIVKYDYLWQNVFSENVLYKLDRKYYERIIEKELLENAQYDPSTVARGEETAVEEDMSDVVKTPLENDTRDRIIPLNFVRNIILKRSVVGSLLDMGLEVLMVSFKCSLYKHMVHVIQLITVKTNSKKRQDKVPNVPGQLKVVIESILMTMGALQFTDIPVLVTLNIFGILSKADDKEMKNDVIIKYSEVLSNNSNTMLSYLRKNCISKPDASKNKTIEMRVADMKGVFRMDFLYNPNKSVAVHTNPGRYNNMVSEIKVKLDTVFGNTSQLNGMSKIMWNDIFDFRNKSKSNS